MHLFQSVEDCLLGYLMDQLNLQVMIQTWQKIDNEEVKLVAINIIFSENLVSTLFQFTTTVPLILSYQVILGSIPTMQTVPGLSLQNLEKEFSFISLPSAQKHIQPARWIRLSRCPSEVHSQATVYPLSTVHPLSLVNPSTVHPCRQFNPCRQFVPCRKFNIASKSDIMLNWSTFWKDELSQGG